MNRSEKVRPKVEAFENLFSEIEKYMRKLMSIVDKGEGIAGAFCILGYSTTSGVVLLIIDKWQPFSETFHLQ